MAAQPRPTSEEILLLRQQKQSFRKQIRSRIKSTYPPTENERLRTKSDQVFSRLFALPEYQSARTVGFFLSMPTGEIQTRSAIEQIIKDGKVLYVPRVGLDFEKCEMDLIRCETTAPTSSSSLSDSTLFYDTWPRNKWGIPEPPIIRDTTNSNNNGIAKPGDIDLLIVPGLAFDTHGHRLGQGKGYYDRFIAKMRGEDGDRETIKGSKTKEGNDSASDKNTKPMLVGVCLEEQFLEDVPHGVDLGSGGSGGSGRGIIPVSDHDYIMDMVLSPGRTLSVPHS